MKWEEEECRPPGHPPGRTDPPCHLIKLPAGSSSRHLSADYSPPSSIFLHFVAAFFFSFSPRSAFLFFRLVFHFLLLAFRRHLAAFLWTNFHFIVFFCSFYLIQSNLNKLRTKIDRAEKFMKNHKKSVQLRPPAGVTCPTPPALNPVGPIGTRRDQWIGHAARERDLVKRNQVFIVEIMKEEINAILKTRNNPVNFLKWSS